MATSTRRRDGEPLLIGIDLGGTGIKAGVVTARGRVLGRSKAATRPEGGLDAVLGRMVRATRAACTEAGVRVRDVAAAGVGAPGAIDPVRGVMLEAVNLDWTNVPLARLLGERLGVPVTVENDVTAAVLGESLAGAGRGARHLLGVWVGTGLGGGLVLDGRLYRGHYLTAGELGRGVVLPWAPMGLGSLDQVCSRTGMAETIDRLIRANCATSIPPVTGGGSPTIDSATLARAYAARDPLVVEVVDHAARVLGVSIAGIVTLLSLERVVLGGGMTEALGRRYVGLIRTWVRRSVFPDQLRGVRVVASALWDDAAVIGAALLALERFTSAPTAPRPARASTARRQRPHGTK